MSDAGKEAEAMEKQAVRALNKLMNEHCTNFDRGAVVHWAERGFYSSTAENDRLKARVVTLENALLASEQGRQALKEDG